MFPFSIYVDVLFNHMAGSTYAGTGSAGSEYDAGAGHFPAVPYGMYEHPFVMGKMISELWMERHRLLS